MSVRFRFKALVSEIWCKATARILIKLDPYAVTVRKALQLDTTVSIHEAHCANETSRVIVLS